jgi:hypothetical protein
MLKLFGNMEGGPAMYKVLAVLAVFVAALAVAAPAVPATSATNFRVAQAVPVYDTVGGMGELFDGSTTGAFPVVGSATMSVESFFSYDFVGNTVAGFTVTFATNHGSLTLFSGYVPDTTFLSSGIWTVLSGTGRFASYSGSGTFTASLSGTPTIDLTETVTLTGWLTP